MQTMTQAQYAAHRGVLKSSVSNWKKAGLLVLVEDPANPHKLVVDVMRTDARLNSRIDPMRGRPSAAVPAPAAAQVALPMETAAPAGEGNTVASERLELLREQRVGQAMKNAILAGELVPLIEAERRLAETARMLRERMHSDMRGMAERLAAERDTRKIMTMLEDGIDRVFADAARMMASGALDEDEEEAETPSEAAAA